MYSIVLMAALSTSAAEPGCHWRNCCPTTCCGCYGGYGGGGCYGCYGCYGGCYGCYGGTYYGGCYGGCYGAYGLYMNPTPSYATPSYAPVPTTPMKPAESIPAPKPKTTEPTSSLTNQARVVVVVPADAKVYIDDHLMKATSEKRVFRTPRLDPTQTYYYDVRAEFVRDGKTVTRTQRVILRAGDDVQTAFADVPARAGEATASAD